VASFQERELWDPWVASDSTCKVQIASKTGYVGSTYAWDGEKLGTGRMEVINVKENQEISSHLWFGKMEEPARVTWEFTPGEGETHVVWTYSQETSYPVERLGMIIGKGFLKKSLDEGLANLKAFLEAKPEKRSSLGPITVELQQPISAMVAKGAGTMETIGQQLGNLYGKIMTEIGRQNLQMAGAPFVHYLDFDESTGHSNYVAGFPVVKTGEKSGEVYPATFEKMEVVQAMHTGPYQEFPLSYDLMGSYIQSNSLEITGEAFEFYLTDPGQEPDDSKWQTLIAFPLQ
jgi:effector-binding domain-containing protein